MSDPSTASTAPHSRRKGFFAAGVAGLVLSFAYLLLARSYSFGSLDQPGPRVWPTVVGLMTIVASLCVLLEAWRMPRDAVFLLPSGHGARRVAAMMALLVGYLVGMNYLGNFVASAVFCLLFMRLVSPLPWPRLALASVAIAIGLHLVFVTVLKIPMPPGILGF